MRTNKYPGNCGTCKRRVGANAGTLVKIDRRWVVRHLSCHEVGAPTVTHARFYGGRGPGTYQDVYQNSAGRCEDAPCCGCCG